jgi:hypothetical protein
MDESVMIRAMRISVESEVEARARYQAAMDAVKTEKSKYLQGTQLTEKKVDLFDQRIRKFEPERIRARRTLIVGKVEIPLPGKKV